MKSLNTSRVAATLRHLSKANQEKALLATKLNHAHRSIRGYQQMLRGGIKVHIHGTIALPSLPIIKGRCVHTIWPCKVNQVPVGRRRVCKKIAANETASATGDPHIKGGDGGRFDFQGRAGRVYNLINDKDLRINARFKAWPGGGTAIGEVGYTVTGSGGYSRIHATANPQDGSVQVKVNGRFLGPGQSARLADGGTLHRSRDGSHVYITSREGYRTTIRGKGSANKAHLDVFVRTSSQGVAQDGQLPGGLLGHTFDRGKVARHGRKGRNAQGEGAIDGHYRDYEVMGGSLFAAPKPKIVKGPLQYVKRSLGLPYQEYFGMNPDKSFADLGRGEIKTMWRKLTDQMACNHLKQNIWEQQREQQKDSRKIELLLMAALNSGNMDLAVLMLSSLQTKTANSLTRTLIGKIHSLQKQRQGLSSQMTNLKGEKEQNKASQLQSLANQAESLGTEINLLQTFLQDTMSSKRNTQEFASNWIRSSHETARSIIQNIGR